MASTQPIAEDAAAANGYGTAESPRVNGVHSPEPESPLLVSHPDVEDAPAEAGPTTIPVHRMSLPRPLHDFLVWWTGIGMSLAMLSVAAWVWLVFPVAVDTPHHTFSVVSLIGVGPAALCPLLICLQLICVEARLPVFSHLQDSSVSKSVLYAGLWSVFLACFGRMLQGWPINFFDQRAFVVYALGLSNLSLVGPVGVHDKWHALLLIHALLWGAALVYFAIGASALLQYAGDGSARKWDGLLAAAWDRVALDTPIVVCRLEQHFDCSGWSWPCKFFRRWNGGMPMCPSCPFAVNKAVACRPAIQAALRPHYGQLAALVAMLGSVLTAVTVASLVSFALLVRRMRGGSAKAAEYRPGYWLACTDIRLLQQAMLDVDTKVNDPVAYTMLLEHMAHVKNCYRKDGAEQASLLKGEQRWHYAVVNAGEHTSTGFHWGVGVWDGRTNPDRALIIDPFPEPTAFVKSVPYGRERGVLVELAGAGKQHCSWRCGYFSLWWTLWLDLQPEPPMEALPGVLPAMPDKFPALCWTLLQYMTTKNVQLRVDPEFRAQLLKGVVDLPNLRATEVAKVAK